MSESVHTKSRTDHSQDKASRQPERGTTPSEPQSQILALQRMAGNQAINRLLQSSGDRPPSAENPNQVGEAPEGRQRQDAQAQLLQQADAEPGQPLPDGVRTPIEQALNVDLGAVRVHTGTPSETAADSLGARAYTIGSKIHLGPDARDATESERIRLLTHEAVHTVQQGGRPVALEGTIPVSHPADRAEAEAARIAKTIISGGPEVAPSPALALRNSLRAGPVTPSVQRDIVGHKTWPDGKFEINFKKKDAKAAAAFATETGAITFRPSATAPESDSIRFVQIVRTFDTATGDEVDFTGSPEANRNKMRTTRDRAKNIAPGFYVDQEAASLAKRTKKSDPAVLPFYDVTGPPLAGNKIGKRRGKTIDPAVLVDTPGTAAPVKFNFVTSAKAADTGTWYGTVLWGFETFLDKAGVTKIKNEYHTFRLWRGETTDAALTAFDEFYRNPGASTAPTK